MSENELPEPVRPNAPARRIIWRVVGASLLVLIVGLGAMYLRFVMKGRTAVGLESLDNLPPATTTEQAATNRVRLFFTANGVLLSPEMHEIGAAHSTYDRVSAILRLLLKGPRSATLRSPIPRGVKARALFINDTALTLDLSSEVRDGLRRGSSAELLCVYSIVNTLLLNCSNLKTVTLLIDSQPVETLHGYLDLSGPLVENLALIAPETKGGATP